MKIVIFSDSHGAVEAMRTIVSEEKPDAVIHAGDGLRDIKSIEDDYPGVKFHYVPGNCDFGSFEPGTKMPVIGGKTFFLTHGHGYYVKYGLDSIINNACASGADVLVFGHTHEAYCGNVNGLLVINPGSVGYGRTYGVLTLDGSRMWYEAKSV
ncbi:MAG: metallophosphoesterase [Oscillospiraceae bacterium]|nr:metallophosphoesterase [Oscillospiraceae bacterium]